MEEGGRGAGERGCECGRLSRETDDASDLEQRTMGLSGMCTPPRKWERMHMASFLMLHGETHSKHHKLCVALSCIDMGPFCYESSGNQTTN